MMSFFLEMKVLVNIAFVPACPQIIHDRNNYHLVSNVSLKHAAVTRVPLF